MWSSRCSSEWLCRSSSAKPKIGGIKIHDTRMMRLMEVLLHGGSQRNGWRSGEVHQTVLTAFGLSATTYTLNQLRYDLRKMKAHGSSCGSETAIATASPTRV
jgi:hypothetical protein